MSELRQLRQKLKNHYLNGFYMDRNTFLKADDAEVKRSLRKDDDGRPVDKPIIILKNVVEMTIDHHRRIVAVQNKPKLAVWADAFQRALERYNEQTDMIPNAKT